MHCLLLRHGIAVSPCEWKGTDLTRPLTREGIEKTNKAVDGLRTLGIQPTHMLSSPLTRTQETARIAHSRLGIATDIQLCPELVYDQPPSLLLPLLHQLPVHAYVMCVGHEPHLGQTAALMLAGTACPGLSLKKAGAVLISFTGEARPGQGCLEWWIPPAQLRLLGQECQHAG